MNDLDKICECQRKPMHTIGYCVVLKAAEKASIMGIAEETVPPAYEKVVKDG